jgi:hypothetical protein
MKKVLQNQTQCSMVLRGEGDIKRSDLRKFGKDNSIEMRNCRIIEDE